MRSSVYQTMRRFSRPGSSKLFSEQALSDASVYSDDVDYDISQKKTSITPVTTYITPPNKPVTIVSYNNSIHENYATRMRIITIEKMI
jgi:hypothetical protein